MSKTADNAAASTAETTAANNKGPEVKGSSKVERERNHLKANPYVKKFGKRITYSDDFYMDLYHACEAHPDWTAVEAYESLGFDTEIVGKERAEQAVSRVKKMEETGELFKVNPEDIDFTRPIEEELKGMDVRKQVEYMKIRLDLANQVISVLKKNM